MNFNFTDHYQLSSMLAIDKEVLETSGVIVNDKLTWDANTRDIVKISNARMRMLHMMGGFQCASGGTDKHLHLVYMICF